MKRKFTLVEKVKDFGGLFRVFNSNDYTKVVAEELEELQGALKTKDLAQIEDELGDVMMQTFMMYNKVAEEHGISPKRVYQNTVAKYKARAPHIFKDEFIGLEAETKYWKQIKESR